MSADWVGFVVLAVSLSALALMGLGDFLLDREERRRHR